MQYLCNAISLQCNISAMRYGLIVDNCAIICAMEAWRVRRGVPKLLSKVCSSERRGMILDTDGQNKRVGAKIPR
jgi:hypothetical protein